MHIVLRTPPHPTPQLVLDLLLSLSLSLFQATPIDAPGVLEVSPPSPQRWLERLRIAQRLVQLTER